MTELVYATNKRYDTRKTAKTKWNSCVTINIILWFGVGRRLEERDAYLRLVVVGGQRRGRRVRGRPVVHFRVWIGRGQVDDDG